ncbi:MAG TPA: HD domain-containing phosphohydrolase [Patescibacteria group bacterium]|nr:HD domain-containing phosphohydrolase [Patescibacteria group bacterium]
MATRRILIVDDDSNVVKALIRTLNCLDCDIHATDKPEEAINELYNKRYDIIITDQRMPKITGLEILKEAQKIDDDILGILITGYSDMEVVVAAINEISLFRYITKPWNNEDLVHIINEALAYRKERMDQINNSIRNMKEIEMYKEKIKNFNEKLHLLNMKTKNALLKLLKAKDLTLYEHSIRVSQYAMLIADRLGIDKNRREVLEQAALFHDIGKIAIKDQILDKPLALDEDEFEKIKHHPLVGFEILIELDNMEEVALVVCQHHERIDGTGYPLGIRDIFLLEEAKILSVADSYDALTSERTYRKALSREEAFAILMEGTKGQYDIRVVEALIGGLHGK